ncbi:MAG: pyrroline-5-carboxylate reductase [Verrucomicrobiota bacterium]|jgi:pyrroline-5-carboxylate reductase
MDSQTYRLGFIGAGKLAGSVIRGLVRAKFCEPREMIASEPSEDAQAALKKDVDLAFTAENAEVAEKADVIFVAVKPGVVLKVLRELAPKIDNKLVISLAAGVELKAMEAVANARFMRGMTNTPSAICRAATGITRGTRTTNEDVDLARKIFESIGIVVEVTELQIHGVTALSGSGPAFIYTIIEWLAQGGEKVMLPADIALKLATQTVLGAAQLAHESGLSPEELRRQVVTPGGTTAAGLAIMDQLRTRQGIIEAVNAATARAIMMARDNK